MSEEEEATEIVNKASYLPYAASTLSPQIVPNDLTTFKSRGASQVQKEFRQRLVQLREEYEQALDEFHWSKLVYESDFGFEPVMGQVYHLYEKEGREFVLSMVPPGQWTTRGQEWVGSFRLDLDRRWQPMEICEDFDIRGLAGDGEP